VLISSPTDPPSPGQAEMSKPHHEANPCITEHCTVFLHGKKQGQLGHQAQKEEGQRIQGQWGCGILSTPEHSFTPLKQHKSQPQAHREGEKMQEVVDKACPSHA
jgi:hypothetical protein